MPVLVQTTRDVIRDSDIQRSAVFVGQDVYPVVVIADGNRSNQRCFAALNMTRQKSSKIERQLLRVFNALLSP